MTYELFNNFTSEPIHALEMTEAYNAAAAVLRASGDVFEPEALATVILTLEKNMRNLTLSAVEYMRAA